MSEVMKEAQRCITICNACRYCEGFCAVFPAMELRRTFTDPELKYFANLCHNCRGCYYACQYAPPHEFDLNFPEVMAQLRKETYEEFAWPRQFGLLFRENGLTVFAVSFISVLLFVFGALWINGSEAFFKAYPEPAMFYKIVPYGVMVVLFTLALLFSIFALGKGVSNLWKITEGQPGGLLNIRDNIQAIRDVLKLRYLEGGGDGCNYPDERFSFIRRKFHHFVFYGFAACFASTSVAFIYDHLFHWPAPYGLFSIPGLLGVFGGLAVCFGTGGMMYLKCIMDRRPYDEATSRMDMAFSTLLFLVCFTGLILFLAAETSMMGLLLCVHLGLVFAFFLTMPVSKFLHVVYRYAALVRNAHEQYEADQQH